jgi:hypothetical protein
MEIHKGSYRVVEDPKASVYGWWETVIASTATGQALKIVAIQEFDDDIICFVDWKTMKFLTNGFFRKRKSMDGKEYFELRATTGYSYIVDIALFGEMQYTKPSGNAIIYSISY